jgi:hypothetical protein
MLASMPVERLNWTTGLRCAIILRVIENGLTRPQLNVKLRQEKAGISTKAGKVTVQGSNANVSHTINEDERAEFTNHINLVSYLNLVLLLY